MISKHVQPQAWPCVVKGSTLHHLRENGFMLKQQQGGNLLSPSSALSKALSLSTAMEYTACVHSQGSCWFSCGKRRDATSCHLPGMAPTVHHLHSRNPLCWTSDSSLVIIWRSWFWISCTAVQITREDII